LAHVSSPASGADERRSPVWTVPLSDIQVDEQILAAIREAAASGWWSMGPRVEAFEAAFREYVGSRHAFAVANGTAALHLALLAAGCGDGDEVVLPSLNFVAAANAVTHTGARPVFCDIGSAHDLNLDVADLEAAIGPSTKALLVLHYGGYCCDLDAVLELARRRDLVVIEDAAHALGASWRGRMCGTFGDIGCFSFFSNKNLAVGEGGMVVTDDDGLAERVRLLRSHGMTALTWARHQGHASSYDVVARGFNYRFDELRSAIAMIQLERLDAGNEARAAVVARYRRELHGAHGVSMPFGDRDGEIPAHHLAVVVLPRPELQAAMRDGLRRRGIQTSLHYPPIHRFSAYAGESDRRLPVTEDVADRLLTLPLYPHMRDDQVALVVDTVRELLADARDR
jgi:dTDP-4-amino-4,6-dideoxygalactose transaminase